MAESETKEKPFFFGHQAVVTCAASGIGEAIAEEIRAEGGSVLGIDIVFPEGLSPKGLGNLHLDVTDRYKLNLYADCLYLSQNGKLNSLVISAGVMQNEPGVVDEDEYERIRRINVQGAMNTFETFQPHLKEGATVTFVSSDLINQPQTSVPAYVDSKRLLAEYADFLARTQPGFRILTLLPGPVDTPLFRQNKTPEVLERIEREVGIMSPFQFATTYLYEVFPNSYVYPSGSRVRIYKHIHEKLAS